jgi:prepilin-type N-terminal cleavage/methylation domain-containing protein
MADTPAHPEFSPSQLGLFGRRRQARSSGFTLIELLVATFIVGVTVVGLFSLFVLSLRAAQEAERRVAAVALAAERAEMVRNLPYTDVGTQGGLPPGPLAQEEDVVRNDVTYTVHTDVRYVDDPYDDQAPADVLNTDYKQVRIEVAWPSPNNGKPVLQLMHVAPAGIEGGEAAGTLDFQALSAAGAGVPETVVQLVNSALDPAVNVVTQTDDEGRVLLPGLPEAAGSYELAVGKTGFTSEQTYDTTASFIPDADHVHLSALTGTVTEKTFFIDQVSSVAITTVDEAAQPIGGVAYEMHGTKTIGTDDTAQPVYVFAESGQTDGLGSASYDPMVWDSYSFSIDGTSGYDIKETNLLLPLTVDPNEALDLVVTLTDHTPISLHVAVITPSGEPIDNATVQLTGNGADETSITGVVGQIFFGDLPVNGEYTLEISAPGFVDITSPVTVEDTTQVTMSATPL